MSGKPSNQPGQYDRERVARVHAIEKAIDNLGLPVIRSRQLLAIVSALEVQVEVGGDSPEVNRLLLEALGASVRHQVGESKERPVLLAIKTFEQLEARRCEQVKAGTLPPIVVLPQERLQDLIQEGYELLEAKQLTAACDCWLEAWELVKQLARPVLRSTRAFDEAYPGGFELVFNWCQDLEMELGNAGLDDPRYHAERVRYACEFLSQFPDEDAGLQINFGRAQGEALWSLGQRAEAEAVFRKLVDRFPDDAWGYIGWSDRLWLFKDSPKEYATAEAILQRALARPKVSDRDALLERLEDLYKQWGKPKEQAGVTAQLRRLKVSPSGSPLMQTASAAPRQTAGSATSGKPVRNAPCWCGSGKKYKRCHLASDEAATRVRL